LQILGTENEMIKVEQIRELTAELNVTPHKGKMRVALINHAHLMNAASANALLKTLEEPLGHVALILISERASFLPATIRSRCQNIIFYPPAKDLAKTWLEKNIDLPQQANLLLQLSENVPLQARELSCKLPERAKFLQDIFAFSCGDLALAKFIDNCQAYTWNFIFTNIISLVLDLIKLQYGVAEITNEDQKMKLQKFKIDKIQLFAYIDKLLELNKFISENINLNQQLLLENISLDWMEMVKGLC